MIVNLLIKLLLSVISTTLFDFIRDIKCSSTCCHSITLKEKPKYILDKNWKVVFLSYNYALFYGMIGSIFFNIFLDPFDHITTYFMFISLVQRLMCAFVMNGIHRNTNAYVHAGYYALYFLGSVILLDDILITYMIMSIVSVVSSVVFINIQDKQYDYSWRQQYHHKKLIDVSFENRNNLNYEQPYLKFEYFHLRLIFVLNIYFTYSYIFS